MKSSLVFFAVAVAAVPLASTPSNAQVTCQTGNCTTGMTAGSPDLPFQCQNIATPRTIQISLTSNPFRFEPANIRVEGESLTSGVPWSYQCIIWHKIDAAPWHSATDDTVGDSCDTATNCSSTNLTPPCDWDTGNIDDTLEFGTCHYAAVPPAIYDFRCRLHQGLGILRARLQKSKPIPTPGKTSSTQLSKTSNFSPLAGSPLVRARPVR